jgi:hypothetical protein
MIGLSFEDLSVHLLRFRQLSRPMERHRFTNAGGGSGEPAGEAFCAGPCCRRPAGTVSDPTCDFLLMLACFHRPQSSEVGIYRGCGSTGRKARKHVVAEAAVVGIFRR